MKLALLSETPGELPEAIEQKIHAKVMIVNSIAALAWQAPAQRSDAQAAGSPVHQAMAIKHWLVWRVLRLKKPSSACEVALLEFTSRRRVSLNEWSAGRKYAHNFSWRGAAWPRRAGH